VQVPVAPVAVHPGTYAAILGARTAAASRSRLKPRSELLRSRSPPLHRRRHFPHTSRSFSAVMVSKSLGSHGRPISRPVSGRGGFGEVFVDALADRRLIAVAVTRCTEDPQTFLVVWFEAGECRDVLVVLELPLKCDLGHFVETTDQGVDVDD